jgi:hypothetical protein
MDKIELTEKELAVLKGRMSATEVDKTIKYADDLVRSSIDFTAIRKVTQYVTKRP